VACRHPSVQSEGSPALAKALLVQGTHCGAFALGAIQGNRVDPPDSRWRVAEGRHPTLVRPSHAASTPRACWEILPVGAHFSAVKPWRRAERPPGRPGYRRRDPFVRGRSLAAADLVSSDVRAADASLSSPDCRRDDRRVPGRSSYLGGRAPGSRMSTRSSSTWMICIGSRIQGNGCRTQAISPASSRRR
jgi:hypothetical protein